MKRKDKGDSSPNADAGADLPPAVTSPSEPELEDATDGHDGWGEVRPRKSQPPEER